MNVSTPPAPPPASPRVLYRRRTDRRLGGVAGGLADYLGVSATVVRIVFVVTTFMGGLGVIGYLLGMLLIPEEATGDAIGLRIVGGRRDLLLALCLVVAGLVAALSNAHDFDVAVIVLLLAAGAFLWLRSNPTAPAVHSAWAPPTPFPTHTGASGWPQRPTIHEAQRSRRRPVNLLLALGIVVAACVGGMITATFSSATAVVVVPLVVLLIGAIVLTVTGRRPWGLATLVLMTAALIPAGRVFDQAGVTLRDGTGTRTVAATEVQPDHVYRLSAGELTVDLTSARPGGRYLARVGAGHLVVTVAAGAEVRVHGHVGAGQLTIRSSTGDSVEGGWAVDGDRVLAGDASSAIDLDVRVGAGQLEIRRVVTAGLK